LLNIIKIKKSFLQPDKTKLTVLQDLDLQIKPGEIIAVSGASGSGKSTLLHLIGALDQPDSGEIYYHQHSIKNFSKKEIAEYRNQQVGFVFQFHYLMPELTVLENVAFPYLINRYDREFAFKQAEMLLSAVALENKKQHMPFQLSGGERQRVAIARSLINSPKILLADEPTGNLDWATGEHVFLMLKDLIKTRELTAIIVTHNEKLAALCDHHYQLQTGKLFSA
jgi:lipoprotein-releasing system ATP-binding protein